MLNLADYQEIERRYHDPKVSAYEQRRCHALLLLGDGYAIAEVAKLLHVSIERVEEWVHNYQTQGLAGIEEWRTRTH